MEKDLSITKEVLYQLLNGVYADSLTRAIKNKDEGIRSKSQNILSLRIEIRDAETEEELTAINEKLKAYWSSREHGTEE
jgi:5-methylcytosine-specific restriction endonuclease McrBC regulatory subunit McrC